MLNRNALPALLKLLYADKGTIIEGACRAISKLGRSTGVGDVEHIQAIIDAKIFPIIFNILTTAEDKTRQEAVQSVTAATLRNLEQVKYLVSAGCIPPMCELLTAKDTNTVVNTLFGLHEILRAGRMSYQNPNPYAVLIKKCNGE